MTVHPYSVGAQLYPFGNLPGLKERMDSILDSLADAGYSAIEFNRGMPVTPEQLSSRGMACCGLHMGTGDLDRPELAGEIEAYKAEDVVASGPLVWDRRTADDWRRAVDKLNETGFRLRPLGTGLHYHNHEFEFAKVEGDLTGFDILLAGIDPDVVDLCFDTGWAFTAGHDPVQFMADHGAGIGYVHLRDFAGREPAVLGRGKMDLPAIADKIRDLPALRWIVVEMEPSPDPAADMKASREYLRKACSL